MRLIALALSAVMLLAPGGGQDKVTICHNGTNTITIGAPAVDAHVNNHGDTLGACAEGGLGPVETPLDPPTTTTTLPPACFDDNASCWDCETMGNQVCGPTTTTTTPPTPPDDHSHEPHSHDEMVLRCTVIDDG